MTSYCIELGYNGATRTGYDEMWAPLKKEARRIADDPEAIVVEARRLGAPESCENGPCCCRLDTYADNCIFLPLDLVSPLRQEAAMTPIRRRLNKTMAVPTKKK